MLYIMDASLRTLKVYSEDMIEEFTRKQEMKSDYSDFILDEIDFTVIDKTLLPLIEQSQAAEQVAFYVAVKFEYSKDEKIKLYKIVEVDITGEDVNFVCKEYGANDLNNYVVESYDAKASISHVLDELLSRGRANEEWHINSIDSGLKVYTITHYFNYKTLSEWFLNIQKDTEAYFSFDYDLSQGKIVDRKINLGNTFSDREIFKFNVELEKTATYDNLKTAYYGICFREGDEDANVPNTDEEKKYLKDKVTLKNYDISKADIKGWTGNYSKPLAETYMENLASTRAYGMLKDTGERIRRIGFIEFSDLKVTNDDAGKAKLAQELFNYLNNNSKIQRQYKVSLNLDYNVKLGETLRVYIDGVNYTIKVLQLTHDIKAGVSSFLLDAIVTVGLEDIFDNLSSSLSSVASGSSSAGDITDLQTRLGAVENDIANIRGTSDDAKMHITQNPDGEIYFANGLELSADGLKRQNSNYAHIIDSSGSIHSGVSADGSRFIIHDGVIDLYATASDILTTSLTVQNLIALKALV